MATSAFYFGASERRLFGIYEAPAKASRRGAVLCNPWGTEYLYAHQSIRFLGQLLAEAGFHVLRFDWYGTGDSAGDVSTLPDEAFFLEDIGWAVDELKDVSGSKRVALVGLRHGAAALGSSAARRRDIDRLVLWDPLLEVESLAESTTPTLVICNTTEIPKHARVRRWLDEGRATWAEETYDGPKVWEGDGDFGSAGMPVVGLRKIAGWLA